MQPSLLPIESARPRSLPVLQTLGTQSDIRYYDTVAKGVLNPPEATGMGFWSINPYVGCAFGCAYCYARYTHRYVAERTVGTDPAAALVEELTELPPWLAFERRIFVKRNAAEVLRARLRASAERRALSAEGGTRSARRDRLTGLWQGEPIAIGTATDPYQPAERTYRVTRGVLEVLADERGLSIGITTKSPLVTRDIDVMARIVARSALTVHVSLISVDRDLARRIEPRAPTPESRLRAVARLAAAGIDVGVNIMPVLPGLTDRPDALDALLRQVAATGARYVYACALRLQASARRRYLPFIAQEFPALAAPYQAAYAASPEMPERYRDGLRRFLQRRCREHGITYGRGQRAEGRGQRGVSRGVALEDTSGGRGTYVAQQPGDASTAQLALGLEDQ